MPLLKNYRPEDAEGNRNGASGQRNSLPYGTHIQMHGIHGSTPEEISAWFETIGMDIPPDAIAVADNKLMCLVSISRRLTAALCTWYVNGELMNGRRISFGSLDGTGRHYNGGRK
jgi:hypothetical protein